MLIVEDENIIALDIKNTLMSFGYDVVAITGSGEQSIQLAEKFHPDLVLMDIRLRGKLSGIQAAKRIQTSKRIDVLYLTACSEKESFLGTRRKDIDNFIQKPFSEHELKHKLETLMTHIKKYPRTN